MTQPTPRLGDDTGQIDFFICHASEDKDLAARPIYEELVRRGHSVWLDEAVLTIGDSLRQSIDRGLANCRFGVVVLSEAFFTKNWPQYELDGLIDRQMAGAKTVLPVWHNITHADVAARSPSLAGLYATSTTAGIATVVEDIVRAYVTASNLTQHQLEASGIGGPPGSPEDASSRGRLEFPLPEDRRATLPSDYADYWEYLLFADALARGLIAHEPAWRDHRMRLVRPNGTIVTCDQVGAYANEACQRMGRIMENFSRLLSPGAQELAFGPDGSHGSAEAIEHLCQRLAAVYGQCLDWAAQVRSVQAPSGFERLFDLLADLAEEPIGKFRTFVRECTTQLAQVPELLELPDDTPLTIQLSLNLDGDHPAFGRYHKEIRRLKRRRRL